MLVTISYGDVVVGRLRSRRVLDPLQNVEDGWSQILVIVLFVVVEIVHGRGSCFIDLRGVDEPFHDYEAEEFPPVLLDLFKNGYLEHEVAAPKVCRYHQIREPMLDPKGGYWHQDFRKAWKSEDKG